MLRDDSLCAAGLVHVFALPADGHILEKDEALCDDVWPDATVVFHIQVASAQEGGSVCLHCGERSEPRAVA